MVRPPPISPASAASAASSRTRTHARLSVLYGGPRENQPNCRDAGRVLLLGRVFGLLLYVPNGTPMAAVEPCCGCNGGSQQQQYRLAQCWRWVDQKPRGRQRLSFRSGAPAAAASATAAPRSPRLAAAAVAGVHRWNSDGGDANAVVEGVGATDWTGCRINRCDAGCCAVPGDSPGRRRAHWCCQHCQHRRPDRRRIAEPRDKLLVLAAVRRHHVRRSRVWVGSVPVRCWVRA